MRFLQGTWKLPACAAELAGSDLAWTLTSKARPDMHWRPPVGPRWVGTASAACTGHPAWALRALPPTPRILFTETFFL